MYFFVPSSLPPPPPREQRNTCQNITFSKLRWRAVITSRKRSLRRLCFTPVYQSFCSQGVAGLHPGRGVGQTPHQILWDMVNYGIPTGMHSCCIIYVFLDAPGLLKRACTPLYREPFRICDNFMECCRNNE